MKRKRETLFTFIMVLMVLGIILIIVWALGKSFGWIHSPEWVNMIPVFGGAVTLAGISIGVGRLLQKIDRVIFDVEKVLRKTDNLNNRVTSLESKI